MRVRERGRFERRGRKGFAEGAEEYRKKCQKNTEGFYYGKRYIAACLMAIFPVNIFEILAVPWLFLLRPLRNLCALCVQKFPRIRSSIPTH